MGTLTRTQAVTHARLLAGDTATTNPGRTDADYIEYIQEAYEFVMAFYGPRYLVVSQADDSELALSLDGTFGMQLEGGIGVEYEEIVAVFYEGASAAETYATPLEEITYSELIYLVRNVSTATAAAPTYYSTHHDYDAGLVGVSATSPWAIMVYPPVMAGTNRFSMVYRGRAPTLAAADTMDATRPEEYLVCRLAALEAMRTIGERNPARWNTVASLIPEEMRANRGIKLYAGVGVSSVDYE